MSSLLGAISQTLKSKLLSRSCEVCGHPTTDIYYDKSDSPWPFVVVHEDCMHYEIQHVYSEGSEVPPYFTYGPDHWFDPEEGI